MRRLTAFLNLSLDGYFTDAHDDMSWAHKFDPEWMQFSSDNAQGSGDGALLFGRRTYEQMAAYWPTPQARQQLPGVADGINRLPKFVVSRTLDKATWNNTTLLEGDAVEHARKLKASGDAPIVILGSGTLIAALTQEQLIDQYTLIYVPVVLGSGRTPFEGVQQRLALRRKSERAFENGNVVVIYERP